VPGGGEAPNISELRDKDHRRQSFHSSKSAEHSYGPPKELRVGELLELLVQFAEATLKILKHREALIESELVKFLSEFELTEPSSVSDRPRLTVSIR
jgi:hypothetical protein